MESAPVETDAVIAAQKLLADATGLLRSKDDREKARASLTIADAMIDLLEVLRERAQAEIKAGNAGVCVNNLLAFLRGPCSHNLVALNAIIAKDKGPGIVVAREMPKEPALTLVR